MGASAQPLWLEQRPARSRQPQGCFVPSKVRNDFFEKQKNHARHIKFHHYVTSNAA